jgi:hypothetical protein
MRRIIDMQLSTHHCRTDPLSRGNHETVTRAARSGPCQARGRCPTLAWMAIVGLPSAKAAPRCTARSARAERAIAGAQRIAYTRRARLPSDLGLSAGVGPRPFFAPGCRKQPRPIDMFVPAVTAAPCHQAYLRLRNGYLRLHSDPSAAPAKVQAQLPYQIGRHRRPRCANW